MSGWAFSRPPGRRRPFSTSSIKFVNAVLKSDEMAPALKRFGYEAKITTPAEFETFFAAELRKWPPILTATGLKPQ